MSAADVLLLVAGVAIVWRLLAFLAGVAAWLLLVVVAISAMVGVPHPAGAVGAAVVLWFVSQLVSRIRHGSWRSSGLRAIAALR